MSTTVRRLALLALAAAVAASVGCGKKKSREARSSDEDNSPASSESGSGGMPSAKEMKEAADSIKKNPFVNKEVGNAMQAMSKVVAQSENVTITAVDFRALRDMLPETAGSLKRKNPAGQKEMGMSTASADYGDEAGNATINIKITDPGQMRAMMAGAAAALSMDMDKETEDGYERNIDFKGLRVHEKKNGNNSELNTLVGDRFLVELNGYNVTPEQLKSLLESIPLKKLEGMKDEGVEKAK